MLVDVHTHLDFKDFNKDLKKVLEKCENFKAIISNGLNPLSNRRVLELAKHYKLIKPALGFYPAELENSPTKEIEEEIEFIRKQKPFAIGEVGLDLYNGKNLQKQKKYFRKFIALSNELNVPIIVHSRKAEQETIDLLKKEKMTG